MYANVNEGGSMEGMKLDREALEGVSGGWTSDQLTPEERAKVNKLLRALDLAQTEEEKLARLAEFQEYNWYLSDKYDN